VCTVHNKIKYNLRREKTKIKKKYIHTNWKLMNIWRENEGSLNEQWNKSTLFMEFSIAIRVLEGENDIYLDEMFGG